MLNSDQINENNLKGLLPPSRRQVISGQAGEAAVPSCLSLSWTTPILPKAGWLGGEGKDRTSWNESFPGSAASWTPGKGLQTLAVK